MNVATLSIRESYSGPVLFKQGFRPFFLAACLWAGVSLLLWIAFLGGLVSLPTRFQPVDWHRHELLFGYGSAVVAGFLLTAAANWTKRPPISGVPLMLLTVLWFSGRLAVLFSSMLSPIIVAVIDLAFPVVLASVLAWELIAGQNYRNLRIVSVVAVFAAANLAFHIQALQGQLPVFGARLGLSTLLILIMLVGGRIIPAFTRNWLLKRGAEQLPAPFSLLDAATLGISAAALLAWSGLALTAATVPAAQTVSTLSGITVASLTGGLLFLAGAANLVRLSRWCGGQTFTDPLVLILHLAYTLVPLGFIAMSLVELGFWPCVFTVSNATHLWTAGAVSLMSMAVMTRASLGHTNQPLRADNVIVVLYAALIASLATRFIAGMGIAWMPMLQLSALMWCIGYFGFVVRFWRLFFRTS